VLLAAGSWAICFYLFKDIEGWFAMALRSLFFITIYLTGAYRLQLTPDLAVVWEATRKRLL
jgi:hypothetical protein